MGYFKELFGKADLGEGLKLKYVQNKVTRTFGAGVDRFESRIDDIDAILAQKRLELANGNVTALQDIISLQVEKKDILLGLEILSQEKEACFEESDG